MPLPAHEATVLHFCGFSGACWLDWAYDWQTLAAGGLAVGAAWWAGNIARAQLKVQRDQIDDQRAQFEQLQVREATRRAALLAARRAALSASLSSVCQFAEATTVGAKAVMPAADAVESSLSAKPPLFVPQFPPDATAAFIEMIELDSPKDVAATLTSILHEAQILAARSFRYHEPGRKSRLQVSYLIVQAVKIHALASSLFRYARNEAETAMLPDAQVSLIVLGIFDDAFPDAVAIVMDAMPPSPPADPGPNS